MKYYKQYWYNMDGNLMSDAIDYCIDNINYDRVLFCFEDITTKLIPDVVEKYSYKVHPNKLPIEYLYSSNFDKLWENHGLYTDTDEKEISDIIKIFKRKRSISTGKILIFDHVKWNEKTIATSNCGFAKSYNDMSDYYNEYYLSSAIILNKGLTQYNITLSFESSVNDIEIKKYCALFEEKFNLKLNEHIIYQSPESKDEFTDYYNGYKVINKMVQDGCFGNSLVGKFSFGFPQKLEGITQSDITAFNKRSIKRIDYKKMLDFTFSKSEWHKLNDLSYDLCDDNGFVFRLDFCADTYGHRLGVNDLLCTVRGPFGKYIVLGDYYAYVADEIDAYKYFENLFWFVNKQKNYISELFENIYKNPQEYIDMMKAEIYDYKI